MDLALSVQKVDFDEKHSAGKLTENCEPQNQKFDMGVQTTGGSLKKRLELEELQAFVEGLSHENMELK